MNDFPFVIKEFRYIFWAYNLIWILLAVYLGFLMIRLNRLSREVRRLSYEEGERELAGPRRGPADRVPPPDHSRR